MLFLELDFTLFALVEVPADIIAYFAIERPAFGAYSCIHFTIFVSYKCCSNGHLVTPRPAPHTPVVLWRHSRCSGADPLVYERVLGSACKRGRVKEETIEREREYV